MCPTVPDGGRACPALRTLPPGPWCGGWRLRRPVPVHVVSFSLPLVPRVVWADWRAAAVVPLHAASLGA